MRTPGYLQQLPIRQDALTAQPSTRDRAADISRFAETYRVDLSHYESVRKAFHSDPELSGQEEETAKRIVSHLRRIGISTSEIHTGIGGHGIAVVLRSGSGGPTILLRSDTDALPVKEQTGLPYASKKTMVDATDGLTKPVMHACGHDVHITCLLAAAETLVSTKSRWCGVAILVFQPSEERISGAKRMVEDGLYDKVPIPDVLLGQHVFPDRAGSVGTRAGPFMAATDSMKITFYGRGAHASQPQNSVDPVVLAASAVVRLQTVVSRETSPFDSAVVTVAAVHGGEAENVIVDEAFIRVNVRTFKSEVRDRVLGAIRRIVKAESQASGAEREPKIEVTGSGPATVNDSGTVQTLSKVFTQHFGSEFTDERAMVMGSEDFGILADAIKKPSCFWFIGGTDPDKYDEAVRKGRMLEDIPANHSPFFGPVMQPTLKVGIDAMVTAAMAYLTR